MQNKRKRNSDKQFNIVINGNSFKVLRCVISEETNTLKIVTKVRGQKFPDSSYIELQLPNSDRIYHLQILYKSMISSVILEEWVYTIISSDN